MHINKELELVESFFLTKPNYVDYDVLMLRYIIKCKYDLTFILGRIVYEDFAYINLFQNKEKSLVLDIPLNDVSPFEIIDEKLCIKFDEGKCWISKNSIYSIYLELDGLQKLNLEKLNYDKTDFLELFCNIPTIVDSNNIVNYNSLEINNFVLSLTIYEMKIRYRYH